MRPLFWIASAKKDPCTMPEEVQDTFGYALYLAQIGGKHEQTPLKGFGSADVLEVVERSEGGSFRAVYTVRFAEAIYVLHCFQTQSTRGIAMPKPDIDKIHERLRIAEQHAKGENS